MFEDREDAALKLSLKLIKLVKDKQVAVAAMAKGGVVLGKIVAGYFNVPLNALVIKKIGAPLNPELAVGAAAPENTVFWNEDLIKKLGIDKKQKARIKKQKERECRKQERLLGIKPGNFKGKTVILVDDGVATGASVLAAQKYLKKQKVNKIILAVPVISQQTYFEINKRFDVVIALKKERNFYAVGQFYKNFVQVSIEEIKKLLSEN